MLPKAKGKLSKFVFCSVPEQGFPCGNSSLKMSRKFVSCVIYWNKDLLLSTSPKEGPSPHPARPTWQSGSVLGS